MGFPGNEVGVPQLLGSRNNGLVMYDSCIVVTPVEKALDSLPVIYTISIGKASYFARKDVLENQAHGLPIRQVLQANFG